MTPTMTDPTEQAAGQPATREAVEAIVRAALPNAMFRLELARGGEVVGHIGGPLRAGLSRLLPGDRVVVELAAFDRGKARIVGTPSVRIPKPQQPQSQPQPQQRRDQGDLQNQRGSREGQS